MTTAHASFDRIDPSAVRVDLAQREPWRNVSLFSDDELVDEWMREAEREDWYQRSALDYSVTECADEPAIEDLSAQQAA